jgi:hypothetical protein
MIRFGAPAFLAAGAALALAAIILHLITSTPPRRAPLPTARFVTPTRASAVRLQRRPTDIALLIVRVLFALAIGAAFAQPAWIPAASGTTHIVLFDRGAGMRAAFGDALDTLRATSSRTTADDLTIIAFDTAAAVMTERASVEDTFAELARMGTAEVESDYRIAFEALRQTTAVAAALDYSVTLITVPRWSAYRAGTAAARRAAWSGSLALVGLSASSDMVVPGPRLEAEPGSPLADAAAALGWSPVPAGERPNVIIRSVTDTAVTGWRHMDAADLPDGIVMDDGWLLPVPAGGVLEPTGTAEARIAAVWRDGRVAAAAEQGTADGAACRIVAAFPMDTGWTTAQPWYPELVRRLALACPAGNVQTGAALDAGAVGLLRGSGVDAAAPARRRGRPLDRALLALALLLAAVEWPLRNRRRAAES